MIDKEGKLILTNKTKISNDILDKVKKIVIDKSLKGIWYENIFEKVKTVFVYNMIPSEIKNINKFHIIFK